MTIWRWAFREATEAALIGGALGPNSFSKRLRRLGWFVFQLGFALSVILGIAFLAVGPTTGDPGESILMMFAVVATIVGVCGFGLFLVFIGTISGFLFRR